MSDPITPFRINVPEADLEDLRQRLRRTRWPEAATVGDWSQGIPLDYTRALCQYWLEGYDWRACETGSTASRSSAPGSTAWTSTSCTSARRHPDHVLGIHLNIPAVRPDPATMDDLTERGEAAIATMDCYRAWDSGLLQAAVHPAADHRLKAWSTHPPGCAPGSSRSSGPGPTATATRSPS